MTNWYLWSLSIVSVIICFQSIIIAIGNKVLGLKIKSFFMRKKKGSILVTALGKNRSAHREVSKLDCGTVMLKDGSTYKIENDHIYLDPQFGIPSVIVADKTSTSIDPETANSDVLDPTVIGNAILAVALGSEFKKIMQWLQVLTMTTILIVLTILIQCYVVYRNVITVTNLPIG